MSLNAIHGGKAKHDTIDAHTRAALRRGGMLPQANVSPAAMRAPRDLLRRRMPRMRQRPEWLGHIQQPNRPDNLPAIGKKLAYQAPRDGVAERVPEPAVPKTSAVDRARLDDDDHLLRDRARTILTPAKQHDATTRYPRRTVPGLGEILRLVLLADSHDIQRCPRVHECVSSCRLVTCAQASAGTRDGTSGTTLGKASRKWTFSEAAVLCLRTNAAGQQYLARVENQHGKGEALTVLAHQLARAVDHLLQRPTAVDMPMFPQRASGAARGRLTSHGTSTG